MSYHKQDKSTTIMDTKKLRQKILDLAIHGKLVPQAPNDEPASILLERIKTEKERLIKEGKIKRNKKYTSSDTPHYENVPFEIPEGWVWCKLEDIAQSNIGLTYKPTDITEEGIPVYRSNNIQDRKIDKSDIVRVNAQILEKQFLNIGDLLICARNGSRRLVGKCAIIEEIDEATSFGAFMAVCRSKYNQWIFTLLNTTYFDRYLDDSNSTAINQVTQSMLLAFQIPLPPLAEQNRITAEIERWFALIDQIEQGKADLQTTIKQAKNKILDLAIHGKLVPQAPNDEPAIELLKRINPDFTPCDNVHYENLPDSWCLTDIKSTFTINPKNKVADNTIAGFVPMTNILDGYSNEFRFESRLWGDIKKGFTHFAEGDIVVAKISPCLENRKSAIITSLPNGIGAGTTELFVFRSQCVLPEYGLYFFKSNSFINHCIGTLNGVVGQQRVSKSIIESIKFPLPPISEQKQIIEAVNKVFAKLDIIMESL